MPELERAFDSLEKYGQKSEFATNTGWLLLAYAQIKGPAALPRLRKMIGNPSLDFLGLSLDDSIALSLGLTSYLHKSVTGRVGRCGAPEPRDTLNQFIQSWMAGDRVLFEETLAPIAGARPTNLLAGRSWAEMQAELGSKGLRRNLGMGYRFDVSGRWAEPEEMLKETRSVGVAVPHGPSFALDTLLKDGMGNDCGRLRIEFVEGSDAAMGRRGYLIGNDNLPAILNSISSCAAGRPD